MSSNSPKNVSGFSLARISLLTFSLQVSVIEGAGGSGVRNEGAWSQLRT